MFPVLRPILNKGGAGRYITREESVERLIPMAAEHLRLLAAYDAALDGLPASDERRAIEGLLPNLRTEVSKVYETLFSLGGTAPTGAHGSPVPEPVGVTPAERVQALIDAEGEFARTLTDESDAVHHQERTRAILNHNAAASGSRQAILREVAQRFATA
jgi:hypothetical protein